MTRAFPAACRRHGPCVGCRGCVGFLEDDVMTDIDDPRLIWMSEENFLAANGIVQVYRNRWWACHPETKDILFFHVGLRQGRKASMEEASPQCNGTQEIAFRLMEKAYPWAAIRFVPLVLKPVNVREMI